METKTDPSTKRLSRFQPLHIIPSTTTPTKINLRQNDLLKSESKTSRTFKQR